LIAVDCAREAKAGRRGLRY
jgi:hypothetical protein